jgi:tetratricopeptide (TPR) repeat protein
MTPFASFDRGRRAEGSLFFPAALLLVGVVLLAVTLPLTGVTIPGSRRVAALLDRVPQPWKPPRPVHVPPPDVDLDLTTAGTAASTPAPAAPDAALAAAPAPAAPAAATPAPAQSAPAQQASAPAAEAAQSAPAAPAAQPAPAPAVHPALAAPLPASLRLENFRHQWQTWNNCGPATITMATSHFGRPESQAHAAAFLKPNANDKNVSPDEMVAYVRSLGMRADLLVAGDLEKLKRLVANGIPVVVEMWFTPHPNDGMGHYRLLVGFDDAARQLTFYDSYDAPGVNVRLGYDAFEDDWRVFQRLYIPVYPPEKAEIAEAIVGADRDEGQLKARALASAQAELDGKPNDPFAWFNLGASLTRVGRTAEAVQAFDRARALRLPWRMLWYQFTPFEAYLAEGRVSDVLALAGANLQQASDLEESHYFRGRALETRGQHAQARAAYQAAVRSNPKFAPAQHALSQLGA